MKEYPEQNVLSDLYIKKDSRGRWSVTLNMTVKATEDSQNWMEKKLSFFSMDSDLQKALLDIQFTVSTYLDSVDNDLFKEDVDVKQLDD